MKSNLWLHVPTWRFTAWEHQKMLITNSIFFKNVLFFGSEIRRSVGQCKITDWYEKASLSRLRRIIDSKRKTSHALTDQDIWGSFQTNPGNSMMNLYPEMPWFPFFPPPSHGHVVMVGKLPPLQIGELFFLFPSTPPTIRLTTKWQLTAAVRRPDQTFYNLPENLKKKSIEFQELPKTEAALQF